MSRRITLPNLFNQRKSQCVDHNYQPLQSTSSSTVKDTRRQSYNVNASSSKQPEDIHDRVDDGKHILSAQRLLSQNSGQKFEIVYTIDNGFTSEQLIIIKDALQILADRLFKPEILQNMYRICGTLGCFLSTRVWAQSNLSKNEIYNSEHLLLQYQLMCLKSASQTGEFPTINISLLRENDQKKTKPRSACVSCISHGSTFLIDGEFDVRLCQNELKQSATNICAGVIVYQMLRNLGHLPSDSSDAKHSQLDVFQKCFLNDVY